MLFVLAGFSVLFMVRIFKCGICGVRVQCVVLHHICLVRFVGFVGLKFDLWGRTQSRYSQVA